MRRYLPLLSLSCACLALFLNTAHGADDDDGFPAADAAATVVVFNEHDPVSTSLAGTYAEARHIPFDHVVGISCSTDETVSRDEYDFHIAEPLRRTFVDRGWWQLEGSGDQKQIASSSIRFVALMRGVPLRIAPVANYPGDRKPHGPDVIVSHNEAAVDSELAVLGVFTKQISGPLRNPYFQSYTKMAESSLPAMLLVCRLDGPDASTVQRMIGSSIDTEAEGLWGSAYIDSLHEFQGAKGEADGWFRRIADDMAEAGVPFDFDDNPKVFPDNYPMRNAALYFGWYSTEVVGPFRSDRFRFVPGAIAVHLYSFSADTLRDPHRWCAALLAHGAAATLGNVYEPYVHLTPHLDIFEERLRRGFTFAEAAYASEAVLSWMTTFVGDPLYRPFPKKGPSAGPSKAAMEWVAYQKAAKVWFQKDRAAGEKALRKKGDQLKSGIIYEGLAGMQAWANDWDAAMVSWRKARVFYTSSDDQNRCALHEICVLRMEGKTKEALALVRKQLQLHPTADSVPVLKKVETQLAPPPPSPAPAPTKPRRN